MIRTIARLALPAAALCAGAAQAQMIPTTVTANGSFSGPLSSINDGIAPANGTPFEQQSVYGFGATVFTFAFGGSYSVGQINLTVDNNDDYLVTLFGPGGSLARTVLGSSGTVSPAQGGVENFSFAFAPFTATSATVSASGGDGVYGISEVQFLAAAAPAVPEPATWALAILGFGVVGAALRRRPALALRAI